MQEEAVLPLEEKAGLQQQPQAEAEAQVVPILRGAFRHPFLGLQKLSQLALAALEELP